MSSHQNLAAPESNERNGKDGTLIIATEVTKPQARLDLLFSKLRGNVLRLKMPFLIGWTGTR